MTQQTINIGANSNDGTGDPARVAFAKCNANFSDLYVNGTAGIDATARAAAAAAQATANTALTLINNLLAQSAQDLAYNSPSGSVNNVSPAGFSIAINRLDVTLSGTTNWTGFIATSDNLPLIIRNLPSNAFSLTLNVNNVSSSAPNRFTGSSDAVLAPGQSRTLIYYGGSVSNWVIIN